MDFALSTDGEIKNAKKELVILNKEYQKIREEIYLKEDEIAKIDEVLLNDIVEPLNEDIEEQLYIVCGK